MRSSSDWRSDVTGVALGMTQQEIWPDVLLCGGPAYDRTALAARPQQLELERSTRHSLRPPHVRLLIPFCARPFLLGVLRRLRLVWLLIITDDAFQGADCECRAFLAAYC